MNDMTEMKTKPDIRFAEFTDAWEQRKLGDLGRVLTGNTPPTAEKENWSAGKDGYVWITPTDINTLLMSDSERHLTTIGWEKARIVSAYSVLITSIASIGKNAVNTVPVAFNQQINAIIPEGNDAYFILSAMEQNISRFAGLAGQTATAIINKTEFEKFVLSVPMIQEQQQIGAFFAALDRIITLHQREYDKIVNIKKAMFEKMFPKDGADRPEIRFAGFTDAWQQRKLGDVVEFNPKAVLPDVFEYVDLESVAGTGLIGHRTEMRESAPSRAQRLAKRGDVFYQTVRPYQKNNYLFNLPCDDYVFSTGYAQMRPRVDSYFLMSSIQEERFVKTVLDRCTGTSYPAINANDLAEIEIQLPCDKAEQQKIGTMFKSLDRLITLHQRELIKLQNIKKSLLGKMFV